MLSSHRLLLLFSSHAKSSRISLFGLFEADGPDGHDKHQDHHDDATGDHDGESRACVQNFPRGSVR